MGNCCSKRNQAEVEEILPLTQKKSGKAGKKTTKTTSGNRRNETAAAAASNEASTPKKKNTTPSEASTTEPAEVSPSTEASSEVQNVDDQTATLLAVGTESASSDANVTTCVDMEPSSDEMTVSYVNPAIKEELLAKVRKASGEGNSSASNATLSRHGSCDDPEIMDILNMELGPMWGAGMSDPVEEFQMTMDAAMDCNYIDDSVLADSTRRNTVFNTCIPPTSPSQLPTRKDQDNRVVFDLPGSIYSVTDYGSYLLDSNRDHDFSDDVTLPLPAEEQRALEQEIARLTEQLNFE